MVSAAAIADCAAATLAMDAVGGAADLDATPGLAEAGHEVWT